MAYTLYLRTTAIVFLLAVLWPGVAARADEHQRSGAIARAATTDPNEAVVPPDILPPREGNSIWLEEKIAPSTRWIENLVKPITVWMERKIQSEKATAAVPVQTESTHSDADASIPSGPVADVDGETVTAVEMITETEALAFAKARVQGSVLRVKFLKSRQGRPTYRVKMISAKGEVHILYIDAFEGVLSEPQSPKDLRP